MDANQVLMRISDNNARKKNLTLITQNNSTKERTNFWFCHDKSNSSKMGIRFANLGNRHSYLPSSKSNLVRVFSDIRPFFGSYAN